MLILQDTQNIVSEVSPSNGIGAEYDVPTGHVALCAKKHIRPIIDTTQDDRPEDYFTTTVYTGDDTNDRTITTGFTPDFVWIKSTTQTSTHLLWDLICGDY